MYKSFKFIKKMAIPLILAIFFVSLDRFLKIFAIKNLQFKDIGLVGDILKLNYAENTGIAFSIPFSGPILVVFLCLLVLALLTYILILAKKEDFFGTGLLTITVFGAISNIFDRFQYGFVVDYIDLKWFTVFNLADVMIVGSVFILLIFQINERKSADK